jgi:hypothetical protein
MKIMNTGAFPDRWIPLLTRLPARKLAVMLTAFGLFQCERTAVFNPVPPENAHYRVHHLGTYSSKLDEEKEIEGTIFQTTLSYTLEKQGGQGNGWLLHRKLDTLIARGYHKFSMPNELEKKVDLTLTLDSGFIPIRITGYDSLKTVLGRIQQKEEYRSALLKASDTAHYKAEWRDWWRMSKLLPRGVKMEARKPLSVGELNKTLETLQADSATFDGPRPRMKKSCLDYTLYYHRTDSLSLLMEQFYFSSSQNRKYRKYAWKASLVKGILQYSVNRENGLPCFASKSETSDLTLEFAEEKATMPIHLYRYEEDLYE